MPKTKGGIKGEKIVQVTKTRKVTNFGMFL